MKMTVRSPKPVAHIRHPIGATHSLVSSSNSGDGGPRGHPGGYRWAFDEAAVIFGAVPPRIYIASKPVDFRKGLDGLAALVKEVLKLDPFCGAAFIFRAKSADRIKILIWDGFYKRLDDAKFRWPRIEDGVMRLSPAQASALFEGLDWARVRAVRRPRPQAVQ